MLGNVVSRVRTCPTTTALATATVDQSSGRERKTADDGSRGAERASRLALCSR